MHWFLLLAALAFPVLAQEPTPEKLIESGHWKQARTLVERRLRDTPNDANAAFLASQTRNAFGDRSSPRWFAPGPIRRSWHVRVG